MKAAHREAAVTRRFLAIGVCGLFLVSTVVPALPQAGAVPAQGSSTGNQQPPPPQPSYRVRVEVELVQVDVVVLDRQGQPVRNLTRDQFRVFEDGVEQEIVSFSREEVLTEGLPPRPVPVAPPTEPEGAPSALPPAKPASRLVALYFGPMGWDDRVRAIDAAKKFVVEKLTPADYVAVLVGTALVQNFTNDRATLLDTLTAVEERRARAARVPLPQERGESPDTAQSVAASAGVSVPAAGSTGAASVPRAGGVPQDLLKEFQSNVQDLAGLASEAYLQSVLRDLQGIVTGLKVFPGRKSLVVFASGLEVSRENRAYLDRAVDAANRANVSLYTVDARGLTVLVPGGAASAAAPTTIRERGGFLADRVSGEAAFGGFDQLLESQHTLIEMAERTGGRPFLRSNDLGEVFPRLQQDTSFYYLLAYRPKNLVADGKFRNIRVEVNREDVAVRARPGYYAPKDFSQFTKQDKQLYLREALLTERSFTDIPLTLGLAHFRLTDQSYYVSVTYSIPTLSVPHQKAGEQEEVKLQFFGQATPTEGRGAYTLQDKVSFRVAPEAFTGSVAEQEPAVEYLSQLVLPPGDYRVKFVVQDEFSGRLGSYLQTLHLPAPQAEGEELPMSSLVLTDRLLNVQERPGATIERQRRKSSENGPKADNPLVVGTNKVFPRVARLFHTDWPAFVYFQAYDLAAAVNGQPRLTYQMALLSDQKVVRLLPPLNVETYTDAARRMVAAPATLDLRGLAPGVYELVVTVADEISKRHQVLRESFQIVP